ncbi:metallo-hydrolase/oxidoreductase, partial [Rhizoctonia solani AG-3 Rhs1AP]
MTLRVSLEESPGFITKLYQGNHLVYAFAPLVFGRLADVYSRPISLTLALLLFIVGCIICAASPNAAAFAVGTVFHTIGMAGIGLLAALFIGDHTSLKWRGMALSWTYLVYLATTWAGPALFTAVAWRWTYGMILIMVFALCAPALYLLFAAARSHNTATLDSQTKLKHIPSHMDLVGLLIFTLGFGLTEYGSISMVISSRDRTLTEYSPGRIVMLVIGLLLTFPVFVLWELHYASFPVMPGRVIRRKGVLFAISISFLFQFAYQFSSGSLGYFIFPWMWNMNTVGYFFAASAIAYSAGAPLLGIAYYVIRRYKPFLIIGNVLFILGCGLWLHAARHWDFEASDGPSFSKAYLFTTQVLIGMGSIAIEMSTLVGSQASVAHNDLAIVTALIFAWERVAGTLGSSAVVAVSLRNGSDRVQSIIMLGLALGFYRPAKNLAMERYNFNHVVFGASTHHDHNDDYEAYYSSQASLYVAFLYSKLLALTLTYMDVEHYGSSTMRVVPVPVRSDNYAYLLIDDATNKAAAVDPFDVPKVKAQAEKEGVELTALITTHHHADHSGGNKEFHSVYPNAPVYGGSENVPALTHPVKDGDTFSVGENIKVKCLATPCHTQDSICYYVQDTAQPEQKGVFTGDTLFLAGCGRFFEGTAPEMHKALSYLGTLPDETVVYNGHEYTKGSLAFGTHIDPDAPGMDRLRKLTEESVTTGKSTIGDEKQWNVFMRLDSATVRTATKAQNDIDAMAKLREMKNSFRG